MILTPEFLADLAHYNAGIEKARLADYGPPPTPVRPVDPCGTAGAYRRHKRHDEDPCQPCVMAMRAEWKVAEGKRRRKKAAAREVAA